MTKKTRDQINQLNISIVMLANSMIRTNEHVKEMMDIVIKEQERLIVLQESYISYLSKK